ncbi:MAG: hypothetical protein QG608_1042 [Actinomycetota bacterium]|nr:hypothetical protein [Actinomycetota bacterium]
MTLGARVPRAVLRGAAMLSTLIVTTVMITGIPSGGSSEADASTTDPCQEPTNPVVCENSRTGSSRNTWDVSGVGDPGIQGFSTDISVNAGSPISFKIKTSVSYEIDIYRLGWYQGNGARKIADVTPTARTQPTCLEDVTTGLFDCGNWAVSATWDTPSTLVSGVYLALLTRADNGGRSHIPFVVRNDAGHSDLVFKTQDATWHAYNTYGGSDLYTGSPVGRSYKVSYNRPFATRADWDGRDFLFSNEYPMIRFLERNGYDVSYITDVDADRAGSLLTNHGTFLSVGHDEYWSGPQREHVENARDAGVNLAFFSGNELYWRTRWEKSIDTSRTDHRTLVCYKETWAGDKIDPSSEWTGTFRDLRYTTSSEVIPENALSGTIYMANHDDLPIRVPAEQGKVRFWRNTTVAEQNPGQVAELQEHTVGYESDEDLDNGYRPPGLFHLSTTTGSTPERVTTYGPDVAPGTTTHHMTMYKAASGALVFSAGTIQYAWALDPVHDGGDDTTDPALRQATINVLADMDAQPLTIMSGMVATNPSTDTTPPTSQISSPAAGSSHGNGGELTVTGTATDSGGGIVAGVEVSIDGGETWHPATGTTSWSYTAPATGNGSVSLRSRAVDDSGNSETATAGRSVSVTCPCSLFGSRAPEKADSGDDSDVQLGVRFQPLTNGTITGVRFYKSALNTGTHTGFLWSAGGTELATGTFTNETSSGWQTLNFASPVAVTAGTTYVASYRAPHGHYADSSLFFDYRDHVAAPLKALRSKGTSYNGVWGLREEFPNRTYNLDNYWVDVLFTTSGGDTTPPTVSGTAATTGATTARVTWTTNETADSSVLFGTSASSLDRTASAPGSRTSHEVELSDLAPETTYHYRVRSADLSGNVTTHPATGSPPLTFTTDASGGGPDCPCSVFSTTQMPQTPDCQDSGAVELGMRFVPAANGTVTGVRFFKSAANTGTHTGSLWTVGGTRLAKGTFTNETSSGWQTLAFASPVSIKQGSTYVVSYYAPRGHYSSDTSAFTSDIVSGPLTAPVAGNGVYQYGGGFPTKTWSSSNYWVDVVFDTAAVPDTSAPAITEVDAVAAESTAATVSWTTDELASSEVAFGTSPDALGDNPVSTFGTTTEHSVPLSGLQPQTTYYYRVTSQDGTGNTTVHPPSGSPPLSFTTPGTSTGPYSLFTAQDGPETLDSQESTRVELGVRFVPSVSGSVTAIRFYKAVGNTGAHTGTLWSASGTVLATGTFTDETASGWQNLTLAAPVALTAGTTYVASYLAPDGHYSLTGHGFDTDLVKGPLTAPAEVNGVYRYGGGFPNETWAATNYWVDVVFDPASDPDTTAPVISGANASAGSATSATVTWTTDESATAKVFHGTTADLGQETTATGLGTEHQVSLTGLAGGTTYYYRVSSQDSAGNSTVFPPLSQPPSTVMTPAQGSACPCTFFGSSQVPGTVDSGDGAAVELGLRFRPSTDGTITGIRFYKAAANTGEHLGTLWSSTGAVLAGGTFTGETESGWQTLTFPTPVPVTAGTVYVVSYYAPTGHYSVDNDHFTADVTAGPLVAPGSANGVYLYGGGFPTQTWASSNYWVTPVFTD